MIMSDIRWLDDDEQHVWRSYLDVSRLLNERLQHQLVKDSGLSLPEYEIFVQLSEAPDRMLRMSELAERAVNSRSRLTHTVSRLESRGLVRREPCPDDGRGARRGGAIGAVRPAEPGRGEDARRGDGQDPRGAARAVAVWPRLAWSGPVWPGFAPSRRGHADTAAGAAGGEV